MARGDKDEVRDDPLASAILVALHKAGRGATVAPMDVAKAYAATRARPSDPADLWRRYLPAVRQQAIHLARHGRIEILRKGQPVDPNDFKGVVRLSLPRDRTEA
ncbi:MAG: DUF3253 domain-containing protein [Alphaproteobacteria bacterium]